MELGVKQTAELLGVSEKTIYRWIAGNSIPFYKVGAQYRFSKSALLAWTGAQSDSEPETATEHDCRVPSLLKALQTGGIFYRVEGPEVRVALKETLALMNLPDGLDRTQLLDQLCRREELGTTGIGKGIAVPHCRELKIGALNHPVAALSFPEQPVDFQALDGQPVHAFFTVLSPTPSQSIRLISRLAFALKNTVLAELLQHGAARNGILAAAEETDRLLTRTTPAEAVS